MALRNTRLGPVLAGLAASTHAVGPAFLLFGDFCDEAMMDPLILASGSPRRRMLLSQIGIPLDVIVSGAEEPPHEAGDGHLYCLKNARAKAEFVAKAHPGRFVLAADTEVLVDGIAQGKPRDLDHGRSLLKALSGQRHQVVTAFVLITPSGEVVEDAVETTVVIKELSDAEIEGYLATGEPADKAGGYGIQGIGTFMVKAIEGSYSNVVGLPVAEVLAALASVNGPAPFSVPSKA